jgi:hypothetical protein
MDRGIDDEETLNLETEKTEDHMFLRNKANLQDKRTTLQVNYGRKPTFRYRSEGPGVIKPILSQKAKETKDDKYIQILKDSYDRVHPLIYLNSDQRKIVTEKIVILKFEHKVVLYSGMEDDFDSGDWSCFILLLGEIHIFNNKHVFQDLITNVTFFGYDGPIFNKRLSTVLVEKNSVIGVIRKMDFLNMIHPFSKFATFISRNIRYKDKILDDLQAFKNFILSSIDKGPIDIAKLIELYKGINSCLHPKCLSDEIDITSWAYALNRLPNCVMETYIFILVNKPPKLLSLSEELSTNLVPRMKTEARNRDIYKYLDGKNVIVLREMESDCLDFVSNMCIHIIESTKLRKYITSPITINKIHQSRDDFDKVLEVLQTTTGLYINQQESNILKKVFKDNIAEKLINLCLSYQDVSISIHKDSLNDKDPIENWVQNLWNITRDLLGVNSSIDEIDDLVVDVIQGSKKTLLNCISPHLYIHKDEIFKWAEENQIQLKTKTFLNETDRFIAFSHYYYHAHPEKEKEKKQLNKAHGIEVIEQTFSTGVQILVVNVNKLNPNFIDPNLEFKPASKNHIILHMGYTFGAQSHHIIKPVLMLFGSKTRSINIIGKAGGLVGERTDIILANKVFYDKTHDLSELNYGNIDIEELKRTTKSNIHLGPMLTVAGTILQNNDLLNFYKHVMGCVGLEMEGYYFAREIENCIKHELLLPNFITRCFYYISDLPLDPNQNLSQEDSLVSWDEGIGSMNAIQRYILSKIMALPDK